MHENYDYYAIVFNRVVAINSTLFSVGLKIQNYVFNFYYHTL